jgi:hypothetical protein
LRALTADLLFLQRLQARGLVARSLPERIAAQASSRATLKRIPGTRRVPFLLVWLELFSNLYVVFSGAQ